MSLSQGAVNASPLPGLTLKAWARYSWNGTSLVLMAGQGGLTLTRTATGNYTGAINPAMPDAFYAGQVFMTGTPTQAPSYILTPQSTTAFNLLTYNNAGAAQDPISLYVAVYA